MIFFFFIHKHLKVGTHEGTSPGDQVPSCALPILVKNCSRGDQNLVPATSPTNSNKFEFVGPVSGTSPTNYAWSLRVYCSWGKSLRPNENISSDLLLFSIDLSVLGVLIEQLSFYASVPAI